MTQKDKDFLWSLIPDWAKDSPKRLSPMLYGTLTQKGDQKIVNKVKKLLTPTNKH